MEWKDFFTAMALVLVIEGLMPCLSPKSWREAVTSIAGMSDTQIRRFGIVSIIAGAILLYIIRS